MKLTSVVFALALIAVSGACAESTGINSSLDILALKGLDGVYVLVEKLNKDAKDAGVTESLLQTTAELRLRAAGIPTLTREQCLRSETGAHLYINLLALRITISGREVGYVANLHVSLRRSAWFIGGSIILPSPVSSWDMNVLCSGDRGNFAPWIRESLTELVDKFANLYLTANPKKSSQTSEPAAPSGQKL